MSFEKAGFLETGEVIDCSQVVICTGTFLGGEIHIGMPWNHSIGATVD
jgi:tRNA U34 5-carboxymethylaminomethyl modifying enzyme MnmG/GidA